MADKLDDKTSSVNCSQRASALEESDVQILLLCTKGGTTVDSDRSDFKYVHAFVVEKELLLPSGLMPLIMLFT